MKNLTQHRQGLVGKSFTSDINHSAEQSVKVVNVAHAMNGGFHVHFQYHGDSDVVFCGLQKFLKRYPHELMGVGE